MLSKSFASSALFFPSTSFPLTQFLSRSSLYRLIIYINTEKGCHSQIRSPRTARSLTLGLLISFSAYDITEQSTEFIEFRRFFRLFNSPNVASVSTSIRNEAFCKSNDILVLETASIPMRFIPGKHLLHTTNTQQLPKVLSIFILGCQHPAPTENPYLDKLRANLINESKGKYYWILTWP